MLLSSEEFEGVLESQGRPPWYEDPVLEKSEKKSAQFLVELYRCGVVRFTDQVVVENGLFFVRKKNGKLRLILDARRANQMFRKPRASTIVERSASLMPG